MKFTHKRGFIDRESYVAQYLALAVFITGVVSTIGSDDLLAAFAAGKYCFGLSTLVPMSHDRQRNIMGWRLQRAHRRRGLCIGH